MAGRNGVSLNWGGLDRVIGRAVQKMAARQELMELAGETLVSGVWDRFDKEESPDGTPWKPSHRDGKTLTDTARLKKSVEYAATPDHVMVGSNVPYSLIHQQGGTIRPKKGKYLKFKGADGKNVFVKEVTLPPRPYLGVSKADMEEVKGILTDFLSGAFSIRG